MLNTQFLTLSDDLEDKDTEILVVYHPAEKGKQ